MLTSAAQRHANYHLSTRHTLHYGTGASYVDVTTGLREGADSSLVGCTSQEGDLQLFGLEEGAILDNLPCSEEHSVTAVAAAVAAPYVLLGCDDGVVRIVALLGPDGSLAAGVSQLASMEMRPYARETTCFSFVSKSTVPARHKVCSDDLPADIRCQSAKSGCEADILLALQCGSHLGSMLHIKPAVHCAAAPLPCVRT